MKAIEEPNGDTHVLSGCAYDLCRSKPRWASKNGVLSELLRPYIDAWKRFSVVSMLLLQC